MLLPTGAFGQAAQQTEAIRVGKCKKSAWAECHQRAVDAINNGSEEQQLAGVQMLEKACEGGHGPACEVRGILLTNGEMFDVDPAGSVAWFDQGCEADDASSCNRAAVQRDKAQLAIFDHAAAMVGYERACELGEPWGCQNAGQAYLEEDSPEYDTGKAEGWLVRACDADNADGCNRLGVLYAVHLDDRPRALAPAKKSCELGFGQGCTNAWYLTDSPGPATSVSRWQYARRACDLGHAEGCQVIGYTGTLEGAWRVNGIVIDGEVTGFTEWLQSKTDGEFAWGAEQWRFEGAKVTITRFHGKQVRDEHWVGEVATTVGFTRDEEALAFDNAVGGIGEFSLGSGEELLVNFWHVQNMRLFRSYTNGSSSCGGSQSCRRGIVLVVDDETSISLTPALDTSDVIDEEVPW